MLGGGATRAPLLLIQTGIERPKRGRQFSCDLACPPTSSRLAPPPSSFITSPLLAETTPFLGQPAAEQATWNDPVTVSAHLVSCIKLTVDMRAFDAHAPLLSKSPQHFLSIRTVFYLRYVFR